MRLHKAIKGVCVYEGVCVCVSVLLEREGERESAKFNDTIHTPGDTRDQSLSPVTPKQTFLCDVKPWSSLEPMPFGIVAFSNAS